MNAIVLSPGPSLAAYTPQPADMVIAVNRAALAHPCDWWACCDFPGIRDNGPHVLGNPNLLSIQQTIEDTGRKGMLSRFKDIRAVEDIPEDFCPVKERTNGRSWKYVTFTCAVVFAAWMGATQIDVYGADWEGKEDFDGKIAGENREPERWEKERELYGAISDYFATRGVTIRRLSDQPTARSVSVA